LLDHPDTQLIVADILEKVRPKRAKNEPLYATDYAALAPLQKIAQEANIAIMVITHSNKGKHEDARDTVGGTMGLTGACDTVCTLRRVAGKAGAELHITGRDVDEQTLAMQFQDGFWTVMDGTATLGDTQQAILTILNTFNLPIPLKDIAYGITHVKYSAVRRCVQRMVRDNILTFTQGGYVPTSRYTSPDLSLRDLRERDREKEGGVGNGESDVPHVPDVPDVLCVPHVPFEGNGTSEYINGTCNMLPMYHSSDRE